MHPSIPYGLANGTGESDLALVFCSGAICYRVKALFGRALRPQSNRLARLVKNAVRNPVESRQRVRGHLDTTLSRISIRDHVM